MYHVEILRVAIAEMEDAYNWYELQIAGLGDQFINEVDGYIARIQKNPYLYNVQFSEQFRFATLKRFPFRIVYLIHEERKTVLINSIFHTSRDPAKF